MKISRDNGNLTTNVVLPASKSISNRLLILQFRYGQSLKIRNLSDADDTLLLSSLLDLVRQHLQKEAAGLLRIDTRNAGTVMRFMVPLLAATRGHFLLTGSDRMKQRPVGALVDALVEMGASVEYLENIGFPPLLIKGRTILGHRVKVDAAVSSQFLTALLLMAPALPEGLTVELYGAPVSSPYVKMTTGLLEELGVQVITQEDSIRVFPKPSIRTEVTVEADWSSASFWYCMLSMASSGEIVFPGLKKSGLQGDQEIGNMFNSLGIRTIEEQSNLRIVREGQSTGNFFADFTDYPDLAMPVIMACAATGTPGTFVGLERLRLKESDRVTAMTSGLKKAGITLSEEYPGTWRLSGHLTDPSALFIDDYNDHRIAMTFACLAMKGFAVHIPNPDCVNKSYPRFWKELQNAGFECRFSC